MGLYDTLECEYPLPGSDEIEWPNGKSFQTKDLDLMLGYYFITRDGLLTGANGQRVDFDGAVTFYDSPLRTYAHSDWVEYTAEFKAGKLVSIRRNKNNII